MECQPDTQEVPIPEDTNARGTAATKALADLLAKPATLEPKTRDHRLTGYINEQIRRLRQPRLADEVDPAFLRHLEAVRKAFNEEIPLSVTERVRTLMRAGVEGVDLIDELTKMMDELPIPETEVEPQRPSTSGVNIICSMGITGIESETGSPN